MPLRAQDAELMDTKKMHAQMLPDVSIVEKHIMHTIDHAIKTWWKQNSLLFKWRKNIENWSKIESYRSAPRVLWAIQYSGSRWWIWRDEGKGWPAGATLNASPLPPSTNAVKPLRFINVEVLETSTSENNTNADKHKIQGWIPINKNKTIAIGVNTDHSNEI